MSDYQGLGVYPTPPPKRRGSTVLASLVAVVVVLGAVAALLFVRVTEKTPGEALPVTGVGPAAGSSTKPNDPLQPQRTGAPLVPGWKVRQLFDSDKAYDVPQDWIPVEGNLATWGPHKEVSLTVPSVYKHSWCPQSQNSWRSIAGLLVRPHRDNLAVGAAETAQFVANTVFTTTARVQPETELSEPQDVTIFRDKKGVVVTAKLKSPVTDKETCSAKSAMIAVMMLERNKPEDETSVTLLAMTNQDAPDATSEQDLKRIVTSLHMIA